MAGPVSLWHWTPSKELSGAVAQVQGTVAAALTQWGSSVQIAVRDGDPTGETIYTTEPRSFVICGRLNEFEADHGINDRKFGCFEQFRRNLLRPEVITFDELYERAGLIVSSNTRTISDHQVPAVDSNYPADSAVTGWDM
ncbi:Shedu anti-phage system protein SduA domain-containing protein [Rhizobium laguerreae]|uniref:Shedu anti-phage system protein SduA domain-containing protein n=1 Tax=Rhizobium laguerreae TaxID=1076926 RepID=UPI00300CDD17